MVFGKQIQGQRLEGNAAGLDQRRRAAARENEESNLLNVCRLMHGSAHSSTSGFMVSSLEICSLICFRVRLRRSIFLGFGCVLFSHFCCHSWNLFYDHLFQSKCFRTNLKVCVLTKTTDAKYIQICLGAERGLLLQVQDYLIEQKLYRTSIAIEILNQIRRKTLCWKYAESLVASSIRVNHVVRNCAVFVDDVMSCREERCAPCC